MFDVRLSVGQLFLVGMRIPGDAPVKWNVWSDWMSNDGQAGRLIGAVDSDTPGIVMSVRELGIEPGINDWVRALFGSGQHGWISRSAIVVQQLPAIVVQ